MDSWLGVGCEPSRLNVEVDLMGDLTAYEDWQHHGKEMVLNGK